MKDKKKIKIAIIGTPPTDPFYLKLKKALDKKTGIIVVDPKDIKNDRPLTMTETILKLEEFDHERKRTNDT